MSKATAQYLVCFLLLLGAISVSAQDEILAEESDSLQVPDTLVLLPDNPIVMALDSIVNHELFCMSEIVLDTAMLNIHGYAPDSVPRMSKDYIASELELLNSQTPFNLVYNQHVQGFINLYAIRKRDLTSRVMGLSHLYFPMIEQELDKHELPLEFKYLAIVESALRPDARSRAGAVGMWQFMYRTGKIFDLEVTSYVDDRRDPYKSTEAACQYFEQLYKIYGNWELVLAAYNCGPGNVNRAIRRSGGKRDYWDLWPYLPRETRGYVPAFIAVNYVMTHGAEHNLYPVSPITTFYETDTVHASRQLTFEQLSATLEIPVSFLEYLNPMYKEQIIPHTKKPQLLILPCDKVGDFLVNEESIYNYYQLLAAAAAADTTREEQPEIIVEETRKTHVVRSGEYLGSIANRYGCKISDLKDWNGLRTTRIHPGQKLVVFTSSAPATSSPNNGDAQPMYYTIQRGDTLWDIARNHGLSVEQLKGLNGSLNSRTLKPGQRIVVRNQG